MKAISLLALSALVLCGQTVYNPLITKKLDRTGGGSGAITIVDGVNGISASTVGSTATIEVDPLYVATQGGNNTYTGANTFTGAASTAPFRVVAADPGTCTVNQWIWNSTATQLKRCSATDTWTAFSSGGTSNPSVKKCTTGGTTTGTTTAVTLGSYDFAPGDLAAGDVIRLSMLWVHAAGANTTLDGTPRYTLLFGGTTGSEIAMAAATETLQESGVNIYIAGTTSEYTVSRNFRSNGGFIATGTFNTWTEDVSLGPLLEIKGRSHTAANDDVYTLANYCIEVIKAVP
jgi:hypothetical protein